MDELEQAFSEVRDAVEERARSVVSLIAKRLHDRVDEEAQAATALPPGVPQNFRVASLEVLSPTRALVTYAWDDVPSATIYQIGHDGPEGAWHRPITNTSATEAEIGAAEPFIVAPGRPYTAYVQAGIEIGSKILWGDPAVLEISVPEYEAPARAGEKPVASVEGTLANDSVVVPILMGAPGTDASTLQAVECVVDTGAFECAIDATTASLLHLPNLGPTSVGGVGGSATAYLTQVDVQFGPGGATYKAVNAVAIEGFGQNLWGLRFAIDRGYEVRLNTRTAELSYYQG